ncbi:hypothetical protein [Bermanella sp. R86510]|uniref:hypothetical protein n=1 Tax=unclassified Bermanella TaxID=2627862 RepID=UPI0037C9B181
MKNVLLSILLLFTSLTAYSLDKGVGIHSDNKDSLWNTSLPYAIARQGLRAASDDEYIAAFQNFDTYVFGLSNSARVIKVNKDGRSLLGNWPLDAWPNHLFLEGENTAAYKKINAALGEKHSETGDPLAINASNSPAYILSNPTYETFKAGCYQETPLRYGDVDTDNTNELVLMIGKDLIIFSPQLGSIIFSGHYWLGDELSSDEAIGHFSKDMVDNSDVQFIASSGADNLVRELLPAKRSISKFYFGDFDDDNKSDIVIWRKIYESNLKSNPVSGFHRIAESQFHYTKDETGEYQLQTDTTSDTIQGWLTANNLTWQKGFPSKSECEGQEGELIPEMHDPLLNDPDVLK